MTDMNNNNEPTTLLRRGLIGSVFAAICCFTPFLVLIVAGVGLSAVVGWLDYALFPMLFASLSAVAYALWQQAGRPGHSPKALLIGLAVVLSALAGVPLCSADLGCRRFGGGGICALAQKIRQFSSEPDQEKLAQGKEQV